MPDALGHKQYHTEGYEKWVSMRLKNQSSQTFIRQELSIIALLLEKNKLSSGVRVKSNILWDGIGQSAALQALSHI